MEKAFHLGTGGRPHPNHAGLTLRCPHRPCAATCRRPGTNVPQRIFGSQSCPGPRPECAGLLSGGRLPKAARGLPDILLPEGPWLRRVLPHPAQTTAQGINPAASPRTCSCGRNGFCPLTKPLRRTNCTAGKSLFRRGAGRLLLSGKLRNVFPRKRGYRFRIQRQPMVRKQKRCAPILPKGQFQSAAFLISAACRHSVVLKVPASRNGLLPLPEKSAYSHSMRP